MFIKEIRIRNFRSIIKTDIQLNSLSIFVGFNDVGKSNILKSLNLFFNSETDYNKPLDFNQDYCKFTPTRQKKAEEIIIELIIEAPKNYNGAKDIRWKKTWRKNRIVDDEISFNDGKLFPGKSKLYSWLQNIRYTYVPAIRGNSYFQILLAKLHDTLAETVESELRIAGDDFINKIKSNTEEMSNEILERIGMKSQIILPSNLQALFKTLDFATTDGIHSISLSNRGDGIKTRHIPAILKFIADQLNINKVKGSPNVSVIWGYEEPENNIEMSACFKLAEQFIDYTKEIQLLITTHSPGFYSLKNKNQSLVNLYRVTKQNEKEAQLIKINEHNILDKDMGLMPLITPHIEDKIKEIEKLEQKNKQFKLEIERLNRNIIFVEGDDEVSVFSKIIKSKNLADTITIKRDGMGCSGVKNYLMSWSWISGTTKLKSIGIFDNDESGNSELAKLKKEEQYTHANKKSIVKGLAYKAPNHLTNIKSKIHNFPIELEEMYPPIVWLYAQEKGWLEKRETRELNSFFILDSTEQSINDKILSLNFTEIEKTYITFKVPDKNKPKISKYLIEKTDNVTIEEKMTTLNIFFEKEILPFFSN